MLRDALTEPDNLRALVREVAPDVADLLEYARLEVVGKPYFLDDWRGRDSDVLVRLPFRDAAGGRELLVCVLVEHQSDADPVMPLRMLVYSVFYWEQQWRAWEDGHARGAAAADADPAGRAAHRPGTWGTSRTLADLFDVPAELRGWLPSWLMPLWDLPEHPAEELVRSEDAFWQTLAVVRAGQAPADEFLKTLRESLSRLEVLGSEKRVALGSTVAIRVKLGCSAARTANTPEYWRRPRQSRERRAEKGDRDHEPAHGKDVGRGDRRADSRHHHQG